jgi:hypothetical protein
VCGREAEGGDYVELATPAYATGRRVQATFCEIRRMRGVRLAR